MQGKADARLHMPPFVTITRVADGDDGEPEFVICNEASGKYFRANRATVGFLDALNRTGDIAGAAIETGLATSHSEQLLKTLLATGVVVRVGETDIETGKKAKAPVEGRLMSVRFDLVDLAGITRFLAPLGRVLYSWAGGAIWAVTLAAAGILLIENAEKARLTLAGISQIGAGGAALFALMFIALKGIHELGHSLAYRAMCEREGLAPGPIRAGIFIFAMSPFPYTDVTGAWRLKSKWRRAMIGFGGIYFELWIIALLAIFWAKTEFGALQAVILQVAVISGALTLVFNFNPAARLDGYYMLTDILERPNMGTRAATAARTFFARGLGSELPPPNRFDLGYWSISYLYRWIMFSGIFWIAYRFDPRLAAPVLVILVIMLFIRPLMNSFQFARRHGVRPVRLGMLLGLVAAVGALALVPLPHHLRLAGRWVSFETRFVQPVEPARIAPEVSDGVVVFDNPDLAQQAGDVAIRARMLENAMRNVSDSGAERATIQSDLTHLQQTSAELTHRLDQLVIRIHPQDVWTPLASRFLAGSWVVRSNNRPLGAISTPLEAHLRLELPQKLFEGDLFDSDGGQVTARLVHDPYCKITARLSSAIPDTLAQDDLFIIKADVDDPPSCVEGLRNGTALVAWIEGHPKSALDRLRTAASRILQDRLPIEILDQQDRGRE